MFSPILLISIVIQVLLIVHCIKTGRNTIWIWVLALLSVPGAIAYIAVEILPGLWGSRATRRAVRGMRRALDPQQDLRRLEQHARVSGGVDAQQRLADELQRQGRNAEAIAAYRSILRGLYEHDPNLMLGLARAQFAASQPDDAARTLELLIANNPDFKSPDGHLLYARALEDSGDAAKALAEYEVLAKYYAGAEAAVRYASLLRRQGRAHDARTVLQELLDHARVAPGHYRKAQGQWLDAAERALSELR